LATVAIVAIVVFTVVEIDRMQPRVKIQGTVKKGDLEAKGSLTTNPGPATAPVTSGSKP
jgi:hypothetical protein